MSDLNMTVTSSFQLVLAEIIQPVSKRHSYLPPASAVDQVRNALSKALDVRCTTCGESYFFAAGVNAGDFGAEPGNWSVGEDATALPTNDGVTAAGSTNANIRFSGVKITTPVSKLDTAKVTSTHGDHTHIITWKSEYRAMLDHLNSTLGQVSSTGASKALLYASENCRNTVSIDAAGPISAVGFTSSTYQRVEKVVSACARQIDTLHGGHGSTDSPPQQEQAPVCFGTTKPQTAIIFPQAPSTLHSATALAWLDICTSLVARCSNAEDSYLAWQLSRQGGFTSPKFWASNFIEVCGASQSTMLFYNDYKGHEARTAENVCKAMLAVWSGSELGPLALHVANKVHERNTMARVKTKMMLGMYGQQYPEEYLRVAGRQLEVEL